MAADRIGRKTEPLDPAAEASEEEPSEAAVETEETAVTVQDEAAAGVVGSVAESVADGSAGESATEEVPLEQYQAPALPAQPSVLRSSADDQTVGTDPVFSTASGDASATSEVLSQPSISTDEAPAVITSHVSAGSAAEHGGTQGLAPDTVARQSAISTSTGGVPRTAAVQTVLIPSSDHELGIAAATDPLAGVGPAFEQRSVEEAGSIDVLVTPQRPASLAATEGSEPVSAAGRVAESDAEASRDEDSRTEEPYPESDRGGGAASDGSVVEGPDAMSAEGGEGVANAEPGQDSDGEAKPL